MFRSKNDLTIIDLEIDEKLIDKINKFAPIKYILRNKSDDPHHVLELLEDIIRDLNNLDLEFRIEELESKKESSTNKILSPEDNDLLKKYTDELNEIERQRSTDKKTLDESEKQLDNIKNKIADFEKVLNDTLNKTKTNKIFYSYMGKFCK